MTSKRQGNQSLLNWFTKKPRPDGDVPPHTQLEEEERTEEVIVTETQPGGGSGTSKDTDTQAEEAGREEATTAVKKPYERVFVVKWLDRYKWLRYDKLADAMFCQWCRELGKDGVWSTTGTSNFR